MKYVCVSLCVCVYKPVEQMLFFQTALRVLWESFMFISSLLVLLKYNLTQFLGHHARLCFYNVKPSSECSVYTETLMYVSEISACNLRVLLQKFQKPSLSLCYGLIYEHRFYVRLLQAQSRTNNLGTMSTLCTCVCC